MTSDKACLFGPAMWEQGCTCDALSDMSTLSDLFKRRGLDRGFGCLSMCVLGV